MKELLWDRRKGSFFGGKWGRPDAHGLSFSCALLAAGLSQTRHSFPSLHLLRNQENLKLQWASPGETCVYTPHLISLFPGDL